MSYSRHVNKRLYIAAANRLPAFTGVITSHPTSCEVRFRPKCPSMLGLVQEYETYLTPKWSPMNVYTLIHTEVFAGRPRDVLS